MSIRRVVVLVNESAGPGSDPGDGPAPEDLEAAFDDVGVSAQATRVSPARFSSYIGALWSGADSPDAVVVVGGDGTVSAAAEAVAGTDVVLGVLPGGTFNHFARDIGMPTDMHDAVGALAKAQVASLDVAEVNGHVFINNSVLGVYPAMVKGREALQDEHGWSKLQAVPVASARVLRSYPVHRLDITTSDQSIKRHVRTPFVFVGNGIYGNGDGGPPSRHSLSGATLGLTVAEATSRLGLIGTFARALVGGARKAPAVSTAAVREVTIDAGGRLKVALDGEVVQLTPPLRYRIRPGALKVLVPRQFG